ncbi:MAG: hypothetical protein CMH57_15600 [Myxococcales bacterium]|nr:hypothetical protein [Myxococcales bacterium]
MQKKETAIEVKVGALVLFSTALLVAFVIILGDFSFDKGTMIYVDFDNVGGLKPGADVAISGIKAGKVQRLEFMGGAPDEDLGRNLMVRAHVMIEPSMAKAVRRDSAFYITTQGVLGEKYIEILTLDMNAEPVAVGDQLRGVDPPRMELLMARLDDIANELADLMSNKDIPVGDLIRNTNALMANANGILTDNRDNIDSIIGNVEKVSGDAVEIADAVKVGVGDGSEIRTSLVNVRNLTNRLNNELGPITRKLNRTLDNAESVSVTVKDITTGKQPAIEGAIDNLYATSANAKLISDDVKVTTDAIRAGRGTIGGLVTDQEIYDDLKEMLRELKRRPWKIIWKE